MLPFHLSHEQAVEQVRKFANKRRMFALKRFKEEFTPENVVGVYMPYLLVDGNAHADIAGHGEIKTRQYQRGSDNNKRTYYDADVYRVTRSFDFTVDDLTIESSSARPDSLAPETAGPMTRLATSLSLPSRIDLSSWSSRDPAGRSSSTQG